MEGSDEDFEADLDTRKVLTLSPCETLVTALTNAS